MAEDAIEAGAGKLMLEKLAAFVKRGQGTGDRG
jgi:hypothetical protein